jgi:hypothetical protein
MVPSQSDLFTASEEPSSLPGPLKDAAIPPRARLLQAEREFIKHDMVENRLFECWDGAPNNGSMTPQLRHVKRDGNDDEPKPSTPKRIKNQVKNRIMNLFDQVFSSPTHPDVGISTATLVHLSPLPAAPPSTTLDRDDQNVTYVAGPFGALRQGEAKKGSLSSENGMFFSFLLFACPSFYPFTVIGFGCFSFCLMVRNKKMMLP